MISGTTNTPPRPTPSPLQPPFPPSPSARRMAWLARLGALIGALLCLALPPGAAAQATAPDAGLQNLAYAPIPGSNALYFSASQQGKPVQLVRSGLPGSGSWQIYTGTPGDRVRLTFRDGQGLQDIQALDKGYRITLNRVGSERVEYRLYGPDRRFLVGAALYRVEGRRWMQGIMKTESFPGYPALIRITDVSAQVAAAGPAAPARPVATGWRWPGINLISSAVAEDLDDLVKGFFSASAEQARDFFSAPGHEMVKASLVGAGAFTVKLIGQSELLAAGAGAGAAVVALTPVLVSVGAGVAIGLAADRTATWLQSKELSGTTSVRDLFNRLTRRTPYSDSAPPPAPPPAEGYAGQAGPATRVAASALSLSEQLDRMDQAEYQGAMQEADACRRAGDFDCANKRLDRAAVFADRERDRQLLAKARQSVVADKLAAEEARRREEQRQLALAEERRQAEQRRRAEEQRRAQAEAQARAEAEAERRAEARQAEARQSGGGDMFGKLFASAIGVGIIGSARNVLSEDKIRIASGFVKDVMTDGRGENLRQAEADIRASRGAGAPGRAAGTALAAATTGGGAAGGIPATSVWHDEMTIREVESGKVTTFKSHETNVPGSVVAEKMSSHSAAQALWGGQGGTVTSYSGCGSCGVGSVITVEVKYRQTIDTHRFVRDR